MFTSNPAQQISALGEQQLIREIRTWLGELNPPAPHGIGDDCAVIHHPDGLPLIQTTDSLSYGVHFDHSATAQQAGAKLIKRNLSDIAAMGGQPTVALLNLLSGPDLQTTWLRNFFDGIYQTASQHGILLVGGDISSLPPGQFTAVLALSGVVDQPTVRQNSQPGDHIYVTGQLGGSILNKHLDFEPRLSEGRWLNQSGVINAMMDLTDGLVKDLPSMLRSDQAAALDLSTIPIAPAAIQTASQTGCPPLQHAFCDGEDYELLFTLQANENPQTFAQMWQNTFPNLTLTRIGHIRPRSHPQPQLQNAADTSPIPWTHGYEHLS